MGEPTRDAYVAAMVLDGYGYAGAESPTEATNPNALAYIVVYADKRGERVVNRRPLRTKVVGDTVELHDGKGRFWRLLGYTTGNPRNPDLNDWGHYAEADL